MDKLNELLREYAQSIRRDDGMGSMHADAIRSLFEGVKQPATAQEDRREYAIGYYDGCSYGPNSTRRKSSDDVQVSGNCVDSSDSACDSSACDVRVEAQDERGAFEAWVQTERPSLLNRATALGGDQLSIHAYEIGWDAWQARAAASPVSVAAGDVLAERARRLVDGATWNLGGMLSAESKSKDIPSNAVSEVKSRHLASLRDALAEIERIDRAEKRCRACNGNDGDMPCAYPEGHPRCLRGERAGGKL